MVLHQINWVDLDRERARRDPGGFDASEREVERVARFGS
jgi:hypothetical protein